MVLKASIRELGGKYYGTEVEIVDTLSPINPELVQIWVMGDYEPSERELQLMRDSLTDGNLPSIYRNEEEMRADWFCDGHYETTLSLRIAQAIVKEINGE